MPNVTGDHGLADKSKPAPAIGGDEQSATHTRVLDRNASWRAGRPSPKTDHRRQRARRRRRRAPWPLL